MKSWKKLCLYVVLGLGLSLFFTKINSEVVKAASTNVSLNFNSLPSGQGWVYNNDGTGVPETAVFSVNGSLLHQNTLVTSSGEFNTWGYRLPNVVDPNLPFVLSVRARITGEEHAHPGNSCGFCFYVDTGAELFGFGLSLNRIGDAFENTLSTTVDTTQFHDYRLEGTPGVGYQFFVDNTLVATGSPRVLVGVNSVVFGDLTRGPNAEGDLAALAFVQNQAPDCSTAEPSIASIWPPNHKFASVDILNVTDPDSNTLSINIDSIYQDEPVNTNADGSSVPDGRGIGTTTAEVRAERQGNGNGRFYHIFFTADDGLNGSCSGEVVVSVPVNQGKKNQPIDDGALYNSATP